MKRLFILLAWFPATIATLILSFQTYVHLVKTREMQVLLSAEIHGLTYAPTPFLAYAALPQTAKNIKTAIRTGDARPVIIDLYLSRYNSPMAGSGDLIIEAAEKYGVDPYLFIAIAQQESNLGKKMPSEDCHNAWGYGIHSRGTLCFESWEEGIEAVMKGLSEKFLQKGLTNPQEMMKVYTPLSSGSWAKGVEQFMEELNTGNF
ncbi:glucosaminidase domain-containing protein [Patescibacteria group bacterium]|nr:glucosaminidase domain-containing protein [Patescibacteria group bacterium]